MTMIIQKINPPSEALEINDLDERVKKELNKLQIKQELIERFWSSAPWLTGTHYKNYVDKHIRLLTSK